MLVTIGLFIWSVVSFLLEISVKLPADFVKWALIVAFLCIAVGTGLQLAAKYGHA